MSHKLIQDTDRGKDAVKPKRQRISELKAQHKALYASQEYEMCLHILETLMAIGPMECDNKEKRLQYIEQVHHRWTLCHYQLGILQWERGNFAQSLIHWIKINQFDENKSASAHFYEGQCHWINNDINKAIVSLQKAVYLKPQIKKYHQLLQNFINYQL